MPLFGRSPGVRVVNIHKVEYRAGKLRVAFEADMPDHIVYLGTEKVSGGTVSGSELDRIRGLVYQHLNVDRKMGVDFQQPDGSFWRPPA